MGLIQIKPGALPPGYINFAPLGLKARGVAPGFINIAPLGLTRGGAPMPLS